MYGSVCFALLPHDTTETAGTLIDLARDFCAQRVFHNKAPWHTTSTQTISNLRRVSAIIRGLHKDDHRQDTTISITVMMVMMIMMAMMTITRDRMADGIMDINKAMQILSRTPVGGMRTWTGNGHRYSVSSIREAMI